MGRRQPEGYEGTHGREEKGKRKGKESRAEKERRNQKEKNFLLIRIEREERMTENKASE